MVNICPQYLNRKILHNKSTNKCHILKYTLLFFLKKSDGVIFGKVGRVWQIGIQLEAFDELYLKIPLYSYVQFMSNSFQTLDNSARLHG